MHGMCFSSEKDSTNGNKLEKKFSTPIPRRAAAFRGMQLIILLQKGSTCCCYFLSPMKKVGRWWSLILYAVCCCMLVWYGTWYLPVWGMVWYYGMVQMYGMYRMIFLFSFDGCSFMT
jgi:hypothetical protein